MGAGIDMDNKKKLWTCRYCNKQFVLKAHFSCHQKSLVCLGKSSNMRKQQQCPHCPEMIRFGHLRRHVNRMHKCITSSLTKHDGGKQIVKQGCFTSVFYEFDDNLWKFKKQFDQYCLSNRRNQSFLKKLDKRAHSFLKKLDKFDKKDEFLLILKKCYVCDLGFTQNDVKRAKCIYCLTQLHEQCSQGLEKCVCQCQSTQLKRIFEGKSLQQSYKTQQISQSNLLRKSFQGISAFKPQTSRQVIDAEEEVIKKTLHERDRFIYSTNAKISDEIKVEIDLKCDPFLVQADQNLTEAYRSYFSGTYKPPLKLKVYAEDSFGIQTLEALPKLVLLGEYAADIVPLIFCSQVKWKDHLMLYYQGATSMQELMLAPFNICNFGPLLNHSDEGNCSSLRIIIDGSIRVLLYTTQKVKAGQELLYDYNGFHKQYPTEGFDIK